MTEIKQLPSGFWAAFVNGSFIDASSLTMDEAERKLNEFLKGAKKRMNDGWVRWSNWTDKGMVEMGQMKKKDMQKNLQRFEVEAKKILENTGADHVVYGRKRFDEDGELKEIRFYLTPMSDDEFERVARVPRQQVYALHKMK